MKLRGKTQRGKNRIANGGEDWIVMRRVGSSLALGTGPAMLVQSAKGERFGTFWLLESADPDVEILPQEID